MVLMDDDGCIGVGCAKMYKGAAGERADDG